MMIEKKIKYFSFLTIFWIQMNIIFNEFNFSSYNCIQKFLFIILIVINLISFIVYFLLSIKKEIMYYKNLEKIFIILFIITSIFITLYYFLNPWTGKEHNWQSIVLEFTDIVIMIFSNIVLSISYYFSSKKKKNLFIGQKEQWNTKGINDNIYFNLFIATSLLATFFSSQSIPYMNRNYIDFIKIFVVIFIIFMGLKNSKIFKESRVKFYLLLSSYTFIITINYFLTISVLDPFLKQKLNDINAGTFLVNIKEFFLICNLIVLYTWLSKSFCLDYKNNK